MDINPSRVAAWSSAFMFVPQLHKKLTYAVSTKSCSNRNRYTVLQRDKKFGSRLWLSLRFLTSIEQLGRLICHIRNVLWSPVSARCKISQMQHSFLIYGKMSNAKQAEVACSLQVMYTFDSHISASFGLGPLQFSFCFLCAQRITYQGRPLSLQTWSQCRQCRDQSAKCA